MACQTRLELPSLRGLSMALAPGCGDQRAPPQFTISHASCITTQFRTLLRNILRAVPPPQFGYFTISITNGMCVLRRLFEYVASKPLLQNNSPTLWPISICFPAPEISSDPARNGRLVAGCCTNCCFQAGSFFWSAATADAAWASLVPRLLSPLKLAVNPFPSQQTTNSLTPRFTLGSTDGTCLLCHP